MSDELNVLVGIVDGLGGVHRCSSADALVEGVGVEHLAEVFDGRGQADPLAGEKVIESAGVLHQVL